jgi:hypothetical protein
MSKIRTLSHLNLDDVFLTRLASRYLGSGSILNHSLHMGSGHTPLPMSPDQQLSDIVTFGLKPHATHVQSSKKSTESHL